MSDLAEFEALVVLKIEESSKLLYGPSMAEPWAVTNDGATDDDDVDNSEGVMTLL